jgi:hypothetical protein
MKPGTASANIFFVRPLSPTEALEIQAQISAYGPVKTRLLIFMAIMAIFFLLMTGSYNSTSGYFQTTQGAVMGIVFLLVFFVSLAFTIKSFGQKSQVTSLERDIKTGLFRIEGQILQTTPQTIKVGSYTFSTKNFSTADLKIGDQIYIEFTQGTFHVFSLGKLPIVPPSPFSPVPSDPSQIPN